jgi:hypothetical protein
MYGKDVGILRLDQLNLLPDDGSGVIKYTPVYLWHTSYNYPDYWYFYMRTFHDFTGKVKISGGIFYKDADEGDIGIDEFVITNGTCSKNLGWYQQMQFRYTMQGLQAIT